MLDQTQSPLINEEEVAAYLRVKPCTVANERKRRRLGHTKVGAHVFYTMKHLDQYLRDQEIEASRRAVGKPPIEETFSGSIIARKKFDRSSR
jgi:hypothetical protein